MEFRFLSLSKGVQSYAPQFKQVSEELASCWVHDDRHYKKLNPLLAYHRQKLEAFLDRYWDYYDQLLSYKQQPPLKRRSA